MICGIFDDVLKVAVGSVLWLPHSYMIMREACQTMVSEANGKMRVEPYRMFKKKIV